MDPGGDGGMHPHRTHDYKGESPHITHKLSKIGPKCRKQRVIPSNREFLDPPLIMSATVGGATAKAQLLPHCGWVSSHEVLYSSTNMELAVQEMNWIGNSIHQDLTMVEQEADEEGISEGSIQDLKELCQTLRNEIDVRYRYAAAKVVRMDLSRSGNTTRIMDDNIRACHDRLCQVLADLGPARSVTPSTETRASPALSTGYKPYIEKLKAPTFSGKVEDWPKSAWSGKTLVSYPDSVEVLHMKSNLPALDAKRVTGVNALTKMWQRLERIYGDTGSNIITVKSHFENFTSMPGPDHKRIQDVFKAIETTVTQLRNLDA